MTDHHTIFLNIHFNQNLNRNTFQLNVFHLKIDINKLKSLLLNETWENVYEVKDSIKTTEICINTFNVHLGHCKTEIRWHKNILNQNHGLF